MTFSYHARSVAIMNLQWSPVLFKLQWGRRSRSAVRLLDPTYRSFVQRHAFNETDYK